MFLKGFHNDKDDEQFTVGFFVPRLIMSTDTLTYIGREAVPYRADTAAVANRYATQP